MDKTLGYLLCCQSPALFLGALALLAGYIIRHRNHRVHAALDLVLSILLVRQYQTLGVFIGTFLSTILTSVWVEPFVLYRRRLHLPVHRFYLRYLLYAVCVGAVWIVTDLVCGLAEGSPLTVLLIRLPLCVVLPNLLFFMAYGRTKEWKRVLERLRRIEWGRLHRGGM